METGMRIKYNRLKKRMSLEDLAADILSVRELKKIESDTKEPSLSELEAICKKLEIPLAPKENPVGNVLVKNFKNSLLHPKNKAKIMEQYADIYNHPLLHANEDVELEYNIQQIRYFIITGDLDSAEDKIREIEGYKEFMNQEQFYLFHKYNGNYNYILRDFEQSLKTYLLADKIAPSTISTSELGDLYYSIGLAASQGWHITLAKKYSEMALKIYQQEFVPKRIVECHLTIAINEKRNGNFKKAKEHFKHALTIGSKLDHEPLKFDTEYNYGYFFFQFQEFELALKHLENALQFKPYEYTSDILLGYCLMIKCYIELNNMSEAKQLLYKGYNMIKEKNLSLSTPSNDSFKAVYSEFMCLYYFMENRTEDFEKQFIESLIPVLKSQNKHFEIGFYFCLLGNTYVMENDFYKASIAFKKSNEAFKSLLTINEEWEES
ncbi:helix-turn-helix domain-containing protein [Planococcus salinarum]|uniref:helix-turn-helix domain-containing protein n=1 Tax=Planococcus salinarum TaxID=622695 RepID=UPI000E3B5DA7|nr:helix-turn-helix transcriptional regulator [Planococcus salinarum]TAA73220.1 helix-turn-helix domain-containing protein [Planococcus salinarum]